MNTAQIQVMENGEIKTYEYDGITTILVNEYEDGEKSTVQINVGMSMIEALDEFLTIMSENEDSEKFPTSLVFTDNEGNPVASAYSEAAQILKEMMTSMDISYPDLVNNNVTVFLYKTMKEYGIDDGINIIQMEDTNTRMILSGVYELQFSYDEIAGEFWYGYIRNILLQNNVKNKEEAKEVIEKHKHIIYDSIKNCLFCDDDLETQMDDYIDDIIGEYIEEISKNNGDDFEL